MLVDRVLEALDIDVELFAICEVAEGADLPIGDLGWVTMHFVIAGEGTISIGLEKPVPLRTDSLCLVRRPHQLHGVAGSASSFSPSSIDNVTSLVGHPPSAPDFVVTCGRIKAMYGGGLDLFDLLEDPLVVEFNSDSRIGDLVRAMLQESHNPRVGSVSMISAMMRECLVLVVRQLSESDTSGLVWINAVADDSLRCAIESVLDDPNGMHSVESMASSASMSRSAFASRFKESFGQTPMHFVRRVRLRRSAQMLRTTSKSTAEVARTTGFASRSHFARTFKAEHGLSPGEFRRAETT